MYDMQYMHQNEKFVGLYMSEDRHTFVKEFCAKKGIKLQAFLTAAIQYVCENEKYSEIVTAQVTPVGK